MRILFLHSHFPAQFRYLAQAIAANPQHQVVFGTQNQAPGWEMPNVQNVVFTRSRRPSAETHPYLRSMESGILTGQAVYRMADQLKQAGFTPDVIYGNGGAGATLFAKDIFPEAKLLCSFEWFYHSLNSEISFDPNDPPSPDDLPRIRAQNAPILLDLDSCDWGIVPTPWQHSRFPAAFYPKLSILHDGVDTDFFQPLPNAKLVLPNLDLSEVDEIVTYVARGLEPYRGFPQFMAALPAILARRPQCHVVIVGADQVYYGNPLADGRTYKQALLDQLPLDHSRVHFTGIVSYGQYRQVLQASSVHVYLSRPFMPSRSLLDALASGCVVIGSNTAPVVEVIEDGQNGLLVDFFEPQQLAERVCEVLAQPDRFAPIRTQARQTVLDRFSLSQLLPQQQQLIETVARGEQPQLIITPQAPPVSPPTMPTIIDEPADSEQVITWRAQRQQLAEQWLVLKASQLQAAYQGDLGQQLLSLQSIPLRYLPLTPTESTLVQRLEQQLAQPTKALSAFLALMPFRFAYQLPASALERLPTPGWLLTGTIDYIFEQIAFFTEVGDADHYAQFIQTWVQKLCTLVLKNPTAQPYRGIARRFTEKANFVQCYFNNLNLKELYQLRSQLIEVFLSNSNVALDYTFPVRSNRDRIKLGILNAHFLPQTETYTTLPVFEHLDPQQFEVTLYVFQTADHPLESYCRSRCKHFVILANNIIEAADRIRADDLDMLWIGSNLTAISSPVALLSHCRLARIQVASGSCPITTGIPNIDYYVIGDLNVTEKSQDNYSETLAILEGPTFCFRHNAVPIPPATVPVTRQAWGIDETAIVFISGANFFKLIPELLHTWATLLSRVPNSVLVLYPFNPNWSSDYPKDEFWANLRRILHSHGIPEQRVIILDPMPSAEDVKVCLRLADVYLDSVPYAGATSLIDVLEATLPIVSLTGETLRANQAAGLLRDCQLESCVVDSLDAYLERAQMLAQRADIRENERQIIREKMAHTPSFLDSHHFSERVGKLLRSLFSQWLEQNPTLNILSTTIIPPEPALQATLAQVTQARGNPSPAERESVVTSTFDQNATYRATRQHLAEQCLALEPSQLQAAYQGELGQQVRSLRVTNLRYLPLLPTEESLIKGLEVQLGQPTTALSAFLALMPYRFAYQLPTTLLEQLPTPEWLLKEMIDYLLEPIAFFPNIGDADLYVEFVITWLRKLSTRVLQNPTVSPWREVAQWVTERFYLVPCYFNRRNLKELFALRAQLIETFLRNCNVPLDYTFSKREGRKRIKLGILNAHFLPCTETYVTLPIFEHLDRAQFEITLYRFESIGHPLEEYCRSLSDQFILLPHNSILEAAALIRSADLDVLWIGSNLIAVANPISLLAFCRLARVQVTSGLSPATTGIRNIDYYVLGNLNTTEASPTQYTETLAHIEGSTFCFHRDVVPVSSPQTIKASPQELGDTQNKIVFISGANFLRLPPELLQIWATLLSRVPNAMLVLYPFNLNWALSYPKNEFLTMLQQILQQYGIAEERVTILNSMPSHKDVLAYLELADIYLDSIPFTGLSSCVDALEAGVPIVTLTGDSLRENQAAGLLRELALEGCITNSIDEYLERAYLLATNKHLREQESQAIRAKMADNPACFDSQKFSVKIGNLLISLVDQWGQPTSDSLPSLVPSATPSVSPAATIAPATIDSASDQASARNQAEKGFKVKTSQSKKKAKSSTTINLLKPIKSWLQTSNYNQILQYCATTIAEHPTYKPLYWYQGLAFALQGQEAQAHSIWQSGLANTTDREAKQSLADLVSTLMIEAERLQRSENWSHALLVRRCIQKLDAKNAVNALLLLQCLLQLKAFSGQELYNLGIIDTLQPKVLESVKPDGLFGLLRQVFEVDPCHEAVLAFAKACFRCVPRLAIYNGEIHLITIKLAQTYGRPDLAIALAHAYLDIVPNDVNIMRSLTGSYLQIGQLSEAIAMAQRCYELSPTLVQKIMDNHMLIRGLMETGGRWQEGKDLLKRQESLLNDLVKAGPRSLSIIQGASFLVNSTFFFPYFEDSPQANHQLRNQVMACFQDVVERESRLGKLTKEHHLNRRSLISPAIQTKPLKVGYLSYCLATHAVGILARSLIEHHDRDRFELYGYFVNYRQTNDPIQAWYTQRMTHARPLGFNADDIAEQIYKDEIDILVDLDSITLDITCQVLAAKPAPIQVSWLGWDSPSLPAVDYFIADPYVVPENAQEYYQETIWRLPQTYIAVDGFEVGTPDLYRKQLNIPEDAVIYLTSQKGYKWHPDTTKLQLQILRSVPNSYFLVKGLADDGSVQATFRQMAEQVGVSSDRLRFLPRAVTEFIHRANLTIADVALDTYPYNGATTTLETLWMGVPLVTRVGQQFAARNSYTMLVNAGIEEGIAWSDEEYVAWGVRLGTDPELRKEVREKLERSRRTAPLWNGQQFAREMESAYLQMWEKFIS